MLLDALALKRPDGHASHWVYAVAEPTLLVYSPLGHKMRSVQMSAYADRRDCFELSGQTRLAMRLRGDSAGCPVTLARRAYIVGDARVSCNATTRLSSFE